MILFKKDWDKRYNPRQFDSFQNLNLSSELLHHYKKKVGRRQDSTIILLIVKNKKPIQLYIINIQIS